MFKKKVLAGLVIITMAAGTLGTPYSVHAKGNAELEVCELGHAHEVAEDAEIMGGYCANCGRASVYQHSSERILRVEKLMKCRKDMGSDLVIDYEITVYNQCSNCGFVYGGRTYTEKRLVCLH